MALSMELLKRLNTDEESLPKRLKLAENVFHAVDVPIIHKEDLILQWLCRTCSTDPKVWDSLKSCLKAKHLDIKNDLKKVLTEVLIATFQNDVNCIHEDVFECCSLLISNDGIQQYYSSKPEELGLLTKSLLECAYKIFKDAFNIVEEATKGISVLLINNSNGLILKAYNTIISVIENIIQIFKSAFTTKDSLRTMFVREVLYPLCIIIDHNCTDSTNRLGAVTHKCIQQLLFNRKYSQSGDIVKDEEMKRLKNLLSVLTKTAQTKNLPSNLVIFNFFFRVAINTFKSDPTVLDMMLRELVQCLDAYKKEVFNSLLKNLHDLTFDFDNKVHDVTLFNYCQSVMDNILTSENMSNVDCDLLAQFCQFNPLIVERKIQDILRKVFIQNLTLKCKDLMISILDASVHLRQVEKLISGILITLRDCLQQLSIAENDSFFSNEFKEKLMRATNNITISQSVVMLRALTYHLKADCLETLKSNNSSNVTLMLQVITELLVTLLDGLCIFEYSGTSASYKKFMNAFNDLKNVLSLLLDEILCLSDDSKIIILLNAILPMYQTQRALKYYIPSTDSEDLELPILENQSKKLIKKIKKHGSQHCKDTMNKLILQQAKMSQSSLNNTSMILKNLMGSLDDYWYLILRFSPEVIPSLSNEKILKLTHLLLTDMTFNRDSFNDWVKVLHKNEIQENKRLIVSILNCVLVQIGYLTTEGVINSISKYLNEELLLEAEINKSETMNDILMSIKEELSLNKWIQVPDVCKIKMYLEVLFHLPLTFLNSDSRLITFMFIFALQMECNQSNEVVTLCNTIFSDLLEKSNIDVFLYVDPPLLLQQLPQNRITQKVLELFLKNCTYSSLKKLVKCSTLSNKNVLFLLESMEHVKSKLNIDQRALVKKAETKLMKITVKSLPFKVTDTNDIKILNLILRVNIMNEAIDEKLKNVTESTIQSIFVDDKDNKIMNELLQDGLQLMIVILYNKKTFQITSQLIRGVWYALFKYPCVDVLLPLLGSSEPKEFSEFLELIHNQLVKTLLKAQENELENICIIWNAILKTNMSNDRSKLRLVAINNLIQTMQSVSIPSNFWPILLKLVQNIIVTKHLYLPGYIIDMSIILGLKSLQENTISTCSDALALCSVLLKTRTNIISDWIPSLLVLYRRTLNITVRKSKIINSKVEEHTFKCLALDIEKFTSSLVKLKKDMIRVSPYLIADLLELVSEGSIASFVKVSLQNCINQLISICDQHGIALLSRTLPASMQEIFKNQLDVYNRFYKFLGKI